MFNSPNLIPQLYPNSITIKGNTGSIKLEEASNMFEHMSHLIPLLTLPEFFNQLKYSIYETTAIAGCLGISLPSHVGLSGLQSSTWGIASTALNPCPDVAATWSAVPTDRDKWFGRCVC